MKILKRLKTSLSILFLTFLAIGMSQRVSAAGITGFVISNNDQYQTTQIKGTVDINGTFSTDQACQVEVAGTIGGSTKKSNYQTSGLNESSDVGWMINWQRADVSGGTYGGATNPITITITANCADNNTYTQTLDYTGIMEIGGEQVTPETIALIDVVLEMMNVRFAGAIYLPKNTTPGEYLTAEYVFESNLAPNYDIWTKTLQTGQKYPFLIEYYDRATDRGSIDYMPRTL